MLYNFGLRKLDAASAVSMMNTMPIFGIIFSTLLLKESVTLLQLLGGAVVLAGVSLTLKRNTSKAFKKVLATQQKAVALEADLLAIPRET